MKVDQPFEYTVMNITSTSSDLSERIIGPEATSFLCPPHTHERRWKCKKKEKKNRKKKKGKRIRRRRWRRPFWSVGRSAGGLSDAWLMDVATLPRADPRRRRHYASMMHFTSWSINVSRAIISWENLFFLFLQVGRRWRRRRRRRCAPWRRRRCSWARPGSRGSCPTGRGRSRGSRPGRRRTGRSGCWARRTGPAVAVCALPPQKKNKRITFTENVDTSQRSPKALILNNVHRKRWYLTTFTESGDTYQRSPKALILNNVHRKRWYLSTFTENGDT